MSIYLIYALLTAKSVRKMEKYKILIFNWRDPKHPNAGGAEKATHEIAKRWIQHGHGVHLVCGNYHGGSRFDNIDGMQVTRLGGRYSIYPLAALHYLRRLRGKYDVIIDEINTVPFFTPFYAKKPKVVFIHQLAAEVLFEELPFVQAKFWSVLEPHILRMYRDMPIVTSQSTRNDLVRIGIPESRIHVINYGVDHNLYMPTGKKNLNPHVLFIGRLRRFKGVHYLIRAMKRAVKEIPNVKLSIIGKGDLEYENYLKKLTKDLNLAEHITFYEFGFRESLERKIEIMQDAWLLAFPSIREGFGLAVVEANACGTPAVATDVPGLRDTVRNNETGILVPPKDVDALAKAMVEVLTNDELRVSLSKKCLKHSKLFDWDKTADQMLLLLKRVVR